MASGDATACSTIGRYGRNSGWRRRMCRNHAASDRMTWRPNGSVSGVSATLTSAPCACGLLTQPVPRRKEWRQVSWAVVGDQETERVAPVVDVQFDLAVVAARQ